MGHIADSLRAIAEGVKFVPGALDDSRHIPIQRKRQKDSTPSDAKEDPEVQKDETQKPIDE